MRTFERYVNRKKITDVKKYLIGRGLTSDDAVRDWCISQDIEPPVTNYFSSGEAIQVEKNPPSKPTAKPTSTDPSDPEVWHVPAAERPLRKSSKAGKKAARSTSRKKSASK